LLKLKVIRSLLNFGGWVAVTNIQGQILTNVDRFFISNIMSVSWVTHYSVPFDALSRLWILPTSLVTTLFPTLASLMATPKRDQRLVGQIYVRSIKYLLLTMVPLSILLVLFAGDVLRLWMGEEFAEKSTRTFQILAIGVPLASLAWIPYTLLQSVGRPDLPAKFLFLESLVYFVFVWVMITRMGIVGAALAWTIRAGLDAVLQFSAVSNLAVVSARAFGEKGFLRTLLSISILMGALFLLSLLGAPLLARAASAVVLSVLFAIGSWRYVLDSLDKRPISLALGRLFSSSEVNAR
jgi:O-antigen/teichoic acid export membrane protein